MPATRFLATIAIVLAAAAVTVAIGIALSGWIGPISAAVLGALVLAAALVVRLKGSGQ